MSGTDQTAHTVESTADLALGETVYTADGEPLGTVSNITETGFFVSVETTVEHRTAAQRSTSGEFGEAYLMWRCMECGEMGEIETLPEQCPNCHAPREDLYYWTED